MQDISKMIRDVPDFPKKGIVFKDITTLLMNGPAFRSVIDRFCEYYRDRKVDLVVGIESRGFIFGAAIAYRLGAGFIPVRKPGKLPYEVVAEEYELEYGTDRIEMHSDAISRGQKVLVVDDLLATGGTASACVKLVERLGGDIIGVAFLIELEFLQGRKKLEGYPVFSMIKY